MGESVPFWDSSAVRVESSGEYHEEDPGESRAEVEGEFDFDLDFENADFRQSPELYRTDKGEQGVLLVEPYKFEPLPHWCFKTPEVARESSEEIYRRFLAYREADDFVGMHMARKFLQMGYIRTRRYASQRTGRKYEKDGSGQVRAQDESTLDNEKAQASSILYEKYVLAREDERYAARRRAWAEREKAGTDSTE